MHVPAPQNSTAEAFLRVGLVGCRREPRRLRCAAPRPFTWRSRSLGKKQPGAPLKSQVSRFWPKASQRHAKGVVRRAWYLLATAPRCSRSSRWEPPSSSSTVAMLAKAMPGRQRRGSWRRAPCRWSFSLNAQSFGAWRTTPATGAEV